MKVRTGFVSNSSSSSFIVYTGHMSIQDKKDLIAYLTSLEEELNEENEEEYNDGWGESGQTWSTEGDKFLMIETYYLDADVVQKIKSFFVEGDYTSIYR